jgi:hypothetical protein
VSEKIVLLVYSPGEYREQQGAVRSSATLGLLNKTGLGVAT